MNPAYPAMLTGGAARGGGHELDVVEDADADDVDAEHADAEENTDQIAVDRTDAQEHDPATMHTEWRKQPRLPGDGWGAGHIDKERVFSVFGNSVWCHHDCPGIRFFEWNP